MANIRTDPFLDSPFSWEHFVWSCEHQILMLLFHFWYSLLSLSKPFLSHSCFLSSSNSFSFRLIVESVLSLFFLSLVLYLSHFFPSLSIFPSRSPSHINFFFSLSLSLSFFLNSYPFSIEPSVASTFSFLLFSLSSYFLLVFFSYSYLFQPHQSWSFSILPPAPFFRLQMLFPKKRFSLICGLLRRTLAADSSSAY